MMGGNKMPPIIFENMIKITNAELLKQMSVAHALGITTPELAKTFLAIVTHCSHNPKYINYPHLEDMKAEALLHLCAHWWSFKPALSSQPIAYLITIVTSSYIQLLCRENKQQQIPKSMDIFDCDPPSILPGIIHSPLGAIPAELPKDLCEQKRLRKRLDELIGEEVY